jgi:hypothetical protein
VQKRGGHPFRRPLLVAVISSAIIATGSVAAAGATHRHRAQAIFAGTGVLSPGEQGFVDATVSGRWCRFSLASATRRVSGPPLKVHSRRVRTIWKTLRDAKPGNYALFLSCAARRRGLRRASPSSLLIAVVGGSGSNAALHVRSLRVRPLHVAAGAERGLRLHGLPAGTGNPAAVKVDFPAGVGGGDFATYWPFTQGLQAPITQGPYGTYSHDTQYTQHAVDVGMPTGTLIRAGFTGVVARVNTGCVVGQLQCGNGYGNYIYLKAADGTCAVMAHMSQISVTYGQQVPIYTPLGLSGGTGDVTGPHLHYDHVDCNTNIDMPWAPLEGGSLAEGTTITSENHPPGQPCTALQGGCVDPIQGGSEPIQGGTTPIQGGGPGAGGGGSPSVSLAQGPAAPAGYRYAITLSGFPANQTVSITCYDSVSTGGFYTFGLTTDMNGSATTASYCYSGDGPDHWVVANGVESNHVSWGGSSPPPPPQQSIHIQESSAHPGWIVLTLNGFSPGSYQYTCHFGSGGDMTYTLSETSEPETYDNGHTCYDTISGDTVAVIINGVQSNTITVG